MRKLRIAIGVAFSVLLFGLVFPIGFWLVAEWVDRLFGLPELLASQPIALILTGMMWTLGLFWILWAYSYLLYVGGGSPVEAFGVALEPTKRLVAAGPYAYVRNPMILGLLFILFGVALLANSVGGVILVPVVALLIAGYLLAFEEKGLRRRFGAEYEDYRKHVPLLIPRWNPYVPPEVETHGPSPGFSL